jgi:hypothetical protein
MTLVRSSDCRPTLVPDGGDSRPATLVPTVVPRRGTRDESRRVMRRRTPRSAAHGRESDRAIAVSDTVPRRSITAWLNGNSVR